MTERRVTAGRWVAVDFGVYREATTPQSWHQRLLAACLAGPAFASHRAAARLSGLLDPAPVEVAALRHRRRRSADVIWHESQALFDNDVTEIEGIPATRPTRTVIDLALVLEDSEYARVYDEAVRRRLTDHFSVLQALEKLGPLRKGSARVRALVEQRLNQRDPESDLETRFDALLRRAGLPTPIRQYELCDAAGTFVARLDFAWPVRRFAVELDGYRYHAAEAESWRRGLRRNNAIDDLDWKMRHYTAWDLDHRESEIVSELTPHLMRA